MAARRRTTTASYKTNGSVAYAPAYDGSAVRVPRREEETRRRPRTKQRERSRALTRAQVQVRQAGQVAPFAVVGFLAVAVFAAMLLMSYVQFAVLNNDMASLRKEMTGLQKENATLSAQYEKMFDAGIMTETVDGAMVRPTGDQVVYLDLSEPDTVGIYGEEAESGIAGALNGVGQVLGEVVEYFR